MPKPPPPVRVADFPCPEAFLFVDAFELALDAFFFGKDLALGLKPLPDPLRLPPEHPPRALRPPCRD